MKKNKIDKSNQPNANQVSKFSSKGISKINDNNKLKQDEMKLLDEKKDKSVMSRLNKKRPKA